MFSTFRDFQEPQVQNLIKRDDIVHKLKWHHLVPDPSLDFLMFI